MVLTYDDPEDLKFDPPDFEVIDGRVGVVELEPLGYPIANRATDAQILFICRVKDASSGRMWQPLHMAEFRATAYLTHRPVRAPVNIYGGHNYWNSLSRSEKEETKRVTCPVAFKPFDSPTLRAGIYVAVNTRVPDPRNLYAYVEFRWKPRRASQHLDCRANYRSPETVVVTDWRNRPVHDAFIELRSFWTRDITEGL